MKIQRTLYWFKEGDERRTDLDDKFFADGTLLNRLLNEYYDGKKIKFINLYFSTERFYVLYKNSPMNSAYCYNGHFKYYGLINLNEFAKLDQLSQRYFLWEQAYDYMKAIAKEAKNTDLLSACEAAYNKGLEIKLNPDYRAVVSEVMLYGVSLMASVWITFTSDAMHSKFTLEKDNEVIFEKEIDRSKIGIEFFLEIYKKIEAKGDSIIIKGSSAVDYLPLKIPVTKELVA